MKISNQINALSLVGHALKWYLERNNIKDAFVHKYDERHYQVLEGNSESERGFLAGEFTTRREARDLRDKINAHIKTAPVS